MTISLNRLIEVRDALAKAKELLREGDVDTWIQIVRAHAFVVAQVEFAAKDVQLEVTE
jgi:hypothetical protein